jgi:Ca2+/Na+ antiporter
MKRLRNRYPKVLLIGTGLAFIISGIDCRENELMFTAVSSFMVGAINILSILFVNKRPFFVKIFLLCINAVFAFLSSYEYAAAGRDKIQYGWAAVGIISLAFMIETLIKKNQKRNRKY